MAQAPASRARPERPAPGHMRPWVGPLVIGLCFALGHGITQRLLGLKVESWVNLGQGFELQPSPGTSLESLRMRYGAQGEQLRGDLDLLEVELADKEARRQETKRLEEQKRQEARELKEVEPAPSEPAPEADEFRSEPLSAPEAPAAPELPTPAPGLQP